MTDRTITPDLMRQRIDALQQMLLSIGESVYKQAQGEGSDSSYTYTAEQPSASWTNGHFSDTTQSMDDLNGDFTSDETIAADYEAVD